ncbi:L-threonine 3-dehydrogenase [Stackebrandtia endophytica]|uniref:L-threonine 3-dehydrogenase n=1 Tax=Stackebrandtia endophytica TaxID=1496996 RepID=A0A543AYE3_9ACTN|nr:alcohol dehydrogenase catalytic domain-containing protein [Stackebrandtia endophytica]TQL77601.1 L-threonine 3-dehydrogenase [Stackebrandtia endophytica]
MKAVVKSAAEPGFQVRDNHPDPTIGPEDVLVRVGAASLCGTDRELYEWTASAQAFALELPVVLGHEGAGTVVDVGSSVRHWQVGDRVAFESHLYCGHCHPCRTGSAHTCPRTRILGMHFDGVFAEAVAVPQQLCVRVPAEVPIETAALLESAGVAMHAIQRSGPVAGQSILVNGCGPIGLAITQLGVAMGARVTAVEPNPFRRRTAAEFGAEVAASSTEILDLADASTLARGGFDIAFEVSGVAGVLPPILDSLRHEATVVTIGHPGRPVSVDVARHVNKRGITLRGVFGRRLWDSWEELIPLVASGRVNLDRLVTHRLGLDAVDEAIGLLTGEANKVLLIPR